MAVESLGNDALREEVNLEQPLGPKETEPLVSNDHVFLKLYDKTNGVHRESKVAHPYYVIGRKGAGKTAFLIGTGLADKTDVARIKSEDVYTRVNDLVLDYSKAHGVPVADELAYVWEVVFFHAAMLAVIRSKRAYTPPNARAAIWHYMSAFGNPDHIKEDDLFAAVVAQVSASLASSSERAFRSDCWSITPAGQSFANAVVRLREILEKAGPKAVHVVVDNMEDLHRRLDDFGPVITALFRLVGRGVAGDGRRLPFRLRFAFPAELLEGLRDLAANAGKDFNNRLTIYWTAHELMGLAGSRLRIFLDLYFPGAPTKLGLPTQHDPSDTEAGHATLRALLPGEVVNGLDGVEKGEAYLMRHTQLLPRHLVMILNQVVGTAVRGLEPGAVPAISSAQLVRGIYDAEQEILDEIFSAYSYTHPEIKRALATLKNEIHIVEKMSNLHKQYNQTGLERSERLGFTEFIDGCIDIGALGVVTENEGRYTQGVFSYTFDRGLRPKEDEDELCVHPLFVQHLFDAHVVDRMAGEGFKAVYPYGSDPGHDRVRF